MASLLPFNPMPTHVRPAALPSLCGQRHPCPCAASGAPLCVRLAALPPVCSPPARHCAVFSLPSFAVVQSLSRVQLSVTPWTAARQTSLSFTIS